MCMRPPRPTRRRAGRADLGGGDAERLPSELDEREEDEMYLNNFDEYGATGA